MLGLLVAVALTALFASFETGPESRQTAGLDLPSISPVDSAQAQEAEPASARGEPAIDTARQTASRGHGAELPDLTDPDFRNIEVVAPASTKDLKNNFERIDYRLSDVREGQAEVPRVYVTGLPRDLDELSSVDDKKRAFIRSILPLVLLANQEIEQKRTHMLALLEKRADDESLSAGEQSWLDELGEQYGVEDSNPEALKRRVDVIPVSLALAQAIVESGWGTSRFALEGNALFGQRTWSNASQALVPKVDRSVRVQSFEDLMASVRSYMHNLNTHPAYRSFRHQRAQAVERKDTLDGYELAANLEAYAEINNYVEKLRGLIRANDLRALETARLDDSSSFYARLRAFETRR